MNFIKNKLTTFLFFIIILTITLSIYTSLLYFNIITNDENNIKITCFILGLVLFFILGIISGFKETKKGWLAGLSSAFIAILIMPLINIIFKVDFSISIIKYLAYLIVSSIGGVIGVNIKTKKRR